MAEVSASNGWSNATTSEEPLVFPSRAYRINSIYQCFEEGFPVPAGLGTYRLRGIPMQNAVVMMDPQPLSYSGKALKPKMDIVFGGITLQEGVDYTISLSANVLPGTAMATVTGMGAFTGSLLVPFKIVGTTTKVGDRLLYKAGSTTYTFAVTKVNQGGLNTSVSAKLVGVVVGSAKVTTLSIPSECTINGIRVDVTAVGTKLGGTFKNVRTVVIGAKVVTIAARAFAKTRKVKNLIVKSARLRTVTNCLKGSKVTRVTTRVWLSKSQRSKYKKWFTKKSGKTGVKFVYG